MTAGSNEDIFGASVSDDDDDADPIPLFLLDGSTAMRPGRSPMMRNSSPPLIIKQSLKNFSGLEGVTPGMLSTQVRITYICMYVCIYETFLPKISTQNLISNGLKHFSFH